MKILALEFSSPHRSVAVVVSGEAQGTWRQFEVVEAGNTSNKPLEMIEEVLRQANVDRAEVEAIAVGLGPGSYTGIRSAIALAQGWQLGRDIHLTGLSSVECLAAQAHEEELFGKVATVIDAQRGEFYLANYDVTTDGWRETRALRLASSGTVAECEAKGKLLVGPEVTKWFSKGRTLFPTAATLGKLAWRAPAWLAGEELAPIYLRQTSFVKAPPPRILPE
ncbi:MAG TPA: tRNA (adenosine(37)-N6)-threonylcarbamoyltransferase complex dimerization subunit type 1 TsaB [Patescibacteria group bacterium]|nr:tRNA (adenosine(37)-N6)-threonylcarbamoyltransferase complex dimerization subunit type 1 TsaB [Patescibacteria group bacterium]